MEKERILSNASSADFVDYLDDLKTKHLELMVELRKLWGAKMTGDNNVNNSVVSVLKKLLNMNQISKERHDKILDKYF